MEKTKKLMIWGSILVISSWLLVFLMVTKAIAFNYFLSFFAYAVFLAGFIIGMIASFTYVEQKKKPRTGNDLGENLWNPGENSTED